MGLQQKIGREVVIGVILGVVCLTGILSALNHFESVAPDIIYGSAPHPSGVN